MLTSPDHYQIIEAKDLAPLSKGSGFGYSLSKEISDVDSNQFNDFAVGAPYDESAVVLRSRPVITFTHKVQFYGEPSIDPKEQGNPKQPFLNYA